MTIKINGEIVRAFPYTLNESAQVKPARINYVDRATGIEVEIRAGMSDKPTDWFDPELFQEKGDLWGWYVVCNDRVVLRANRDDLTVWDRGREFPNWHPQYNGFLGFVFFKSDKPELLPWTTTKREVDASSGVYRRAIVKMREVTRPWTRYTNDRKSNLTIAKQAESSVKPVPLMEITASKTLKLPKIRSSDAEDESVNISYSVSMDNYKAVAKSLGNQKMPYKKVGQKTFNYYLENEVD
ncbi:MAG: hypothetical protein RJS98_13180 [Rhodospirillaceae bacterium]